METKRTVSGPFSRERMEQEVSLPVIFVVEDESLIAMDIQERLRKLHYHVCAVSASGEEAVERVGECHPDLVLMDIRLKGEMDGIDAARIIRDRYDIPVVFLTAYAEEKTLERAKVTEPYGYVLKPIQDRELDINIQIALYRHRADQELRRTKKWLDTLLLSLGDGLLATAPGGRILLMNPAAERLTGWTFEESFGRPIEEVMHLTGEELPEEEEPLPGNLHNEFLIARGGVRTPVNVNSAFVRDKDSREYGSVLLVHDMSERLRYEEELRYAKLAAEQANRAKSEFFAVVTHEFRTPLNGIVGVVDLLLAGECTQKQREYVEILRSSSEVLLSLVNDILDLSKIDAGRLDICEKSFDLPLMLEQLCRIFSLRCARKGLHFSIEVASDVPISVCGDVLRLRQILMNLLENAYKFTHEGGVRMAVAVAERGASSVAVRFSVSDTGIGIPRDKQAIVFDRFTQADGSATRKYAGTGLGLSVARELVGLLGGTISLESEPGKGSTFRVELPFTVVGDGN